MIYQEVKEFFSQLFIEGISHGVVVIDNKYQVLYWNKWMFNHSSLTEKEVLKKSIFEIYPQIKEREKDTYIIDCIKYRRPFFLSPIFHEYLIPIDIRAKKMKMLQNIKIYPSIVSNEEIGAIIIIEDFTSQILSEKLNYEYVKNLNILNAQLYKDITDRKNIEEKLKETNHQLETYQIELKMQNESFRKTQCELEETKSKHFDLYDLAPVGYFSIDKKGIIIDVNLTGAEMLQVERKNLINQFFSHFVDRQFMDIFQSHIQSVFKTKIKKTCELILIRKDNTSIFVQIDSISDNIDENSNNIKSTIIDISALKMANQSKSIFLANMS
ncbi:MAG: PAS domain-containing protein, partial [Desulfobacterales bacterium]|nr:PAS domain-containing protein [Desulfobacterales bacterium]